MRKLFLQLLKSKNGIHLDCGSGENRQSGFVTMDKRKLPNVDIVHDCTIFPYPLPDNCCLQILMSHLWEHIPPNFRVDMMNELWRIMQVGGQLMIGSPYATSFGAFQDPTHFNCPNEATFTYFDPDYQLYNVYKPKKWKIIRNDYSLNGNLEVLLEKREDSYTKK